MLKPGGVYMYDTINRTRRSRLVVIKLMQEWRSTALMEPNLHDWDMFIKPEELEAAMARAGLEGRDTVGLGPARNPIAMVVDMRRRARGDMTYGEFGARNKFREMRDTVAALRRLRIEAGMTTALAGSVPAPPVERLREQVAELAAIHRPSASEGERRAAEWIDEPDARTWRPRTGRDRARPRRLLGAAHDAEPRGGAGRAGRRPQPAGRRRARRRRGRGHLGRHHRRPAPRAARCFPSATRSTWSRRWGRRTLARTVVLVAHHDAAKSGLIFHPAIPAFVWRRFPALIERNDTSPPLMFPVFGGPALAALGSLAGQPGARGSRAA